jgi:hypothetical protein
MDTDKHGLILSFGARASARFNVQIEAVFKNSHHRGSEHRSGVNAALHPFPSVSIRG